VGRRPAERGQCVPFERVQLPRHHEQVQRVAVGPPGECRERVGHDQRVVAAGPCDDHAESVEAGHREGPCRVVAGHVVVVLAVDVEVRECMQAPLAVVPDGIEDAPGEALGPVGPLEGERRRLPEAVVLETGERTRRRPCGRAVDDARLDVPLGGPEAQVDVGRRDHRVARGQERRPSVLGGLENRVGTSFDARAVPNLDVGAVGGFEGLDGRPGQPAGVKLREDGVGRPERLLATDGYRPLVVQPQADERQHTPTGRVAGISHTPSVRLTPNGPRVSGMAVPCVRVEREAGERTREALAARDLVDESHEIVVEEGYLYVPVTDADAVPDGHDVVSRAVPDRETRTMPADHLGFDPSYERLGDVVIVDEDDPERARTLAEAIVESALPVRSVLNRASKVRGTERVREWEVLHQDADSERSPTETVHREYGCEYALDLAEVYFSPRLATERHRVTEQAAEGERAFDMFAGVGPFVIPFAKRGARAVGVDINERAIEYLRTNARHNGVANRVTAVHGDVREVAGDYVDWANRVVMNLPHSADEFLEAAVDVAGDSCTLHYYDIQHESDPYGPGEVAIRSAAEPAYEVTVETRHAVRSYAPHELNVVLDVRLDGT